MEVIFKLEKYCCNDLLNTIDWMGLGSWAGLMSPNREVEKNIFRVHFLKLIHSSSCSARLQNAVWSPSNLRFKGSTDTLPTESISRSLCFARWYCVFPTCAQYVSVITSVYGNFLLLDVQRKDIPRITKLWTLTTRLGLALSRLRTMLNPFWAMWCSWSCLQLGVSLLKEVRICSLCSLHMC